MHVHSIDIEAAFVLSLLAIAIAMLLREVIRSR